MKQVGLCWIRRDIRLHDHAALSACLQNSDITHIAFVFDEQILAPIRLVNRSDRRLLFIAESLIEVHQELVKRGGGLWIRYGNPTDEIPKLVRELGATSLYFNRDYIPSAISRDETVTQLISEMGCGVYSFKDHVIAEPTEIMTATGGPYRVFTPYARAWRLAWGGGPVPTHPVSLCVVGGPVDLASPLTVRFLLDPIGFEGTSSDLKGGTRAGLAQLERFSSLISGYEQARDRFDWDGTSRLSVYIRHGCISIRDMINMAINHPGIGADKWISELIWRDFYQAVMFHYPFVIDHPFQARYKALVYPGSQHHWERFKDGTTGFPIIDAAMRCLNHTGWMHNRLRMVTASFLTKILLIDWRMGERYFAEQLLDFDLPANNGGWQWAAGVGCDAAPYFRIFNPMTQAKQYDPDGTFVRRYCPELGTIAYPQTIVDYATQRRLALELINKN